MIEESTLCGLIVPSGFSKAAGDFRDGAWPPTLTGPQQSTGKSTLPSFVRAAGEFRGGMHPPTLAGQQENTGTAHTHGF